MNRMKVWCYYALYAILFVVVFAFILAMVTAAFVCIPAGGFLALVGGAMLYFKVNFVLTELAPEIMLFGGLFMACISAFLGLVSVRAGFAVWKLFGVVRRHCDRLRGWCS